MTSSKNYSHSNLSETDDKERRHNKANQFFLLNQYCYSNEKTKITTVPNSFYPSVILSFKSIGVKGWIGTKRVNPLSANPQKWSNTHK